MSWIMCLFKMKLCMWWHLVCTGIQVRNLTGYGDELLSISALERAEERDVPNPVAMSESGLCSEALACQNYTATVFAKAVERKEFSEAPAQRMTFERSGRFLNNGYKRIFCLKQGEVSWPHLQLFLECRRWYLMASQRHTRNILWDKSTLSCQRPVW